MARVILQDVGAGESSADVLHNLSVYVDYAPEQTEASPGITLSLVLENASSEDIELLNPYDLVTYTLTDASGWPVSLDAPGPKMVPNSPTPVASEKEKYLKVTGIASRASEKDVQKEVNAERTTIPGNSAYTYRMEINKLVPHREDGARSSETDLPKGTYGLVWTLPLISMVGNTQHSRVLQSPPIQITRS